MSLVAILLDPQSIAAVALCLTALAFMRHYLTTRASVPLPPSPPQGILGNTLPHALYASHVSYACIGTYNLG